MFKIKIYPIMDYDNNLFTLEFEGSFWNSKKKDYRHVKVIEENYFRTNPQIIAREINEIIKELIQGMYINNKETEKNNDHEDDDDDYSENDDQ